MINRDEVTLPAEILGIDFWSEPYCFVGMTLHKKMSIPVGLPNKGRSKKIPDLREASQEQYLKNLRFWPFSFRHLCGSLSFRTIKGIFQYHWLLTISLKLVTSNASQTSHINNFLLLFQIPQCQTLQDICTT